MKDWSDIESKFNEACWSNDAIVSLLEIVINENRLSSLTNSTGSSEAMVFSLSNQNRLMKEAFEELFEIVAEKEKQ